MCDEVKVQGLRDERLRAEHRLTILLEPLAQLLCANIGLFHLQQGA